MSVNEEFVKSLYQTIVQANEGLDEKIYELMKSDFYKNLSSGQRKDVELMIKQVRIDVISEVLGIIDGGSTLHDSELEPTLLLDSINTESELQDTFLEFIEEQEGYL